MPLTFPSPHPPRIYILLHRPPPTLTQNLAAPGAAGAKTRGRSLLRAVKYETDGHFTISATVSPAEPTPLESEVDVAVSDPVSAHEAEQQEEGHVTVMDTTN